MALKLPISYELKKIISFVENNYKEDTLRSIVDGFQVHKEFEKEELFNLLNNFLKKHF